MLKIIENVLLSIIIIIFLHYLYDYCKDNYLSIKNTDLINSQTNKYKNMLNEIIENKNNRTQNDNTNTEKEEEENIKEDLTAFLREQLTLQNTEVSKIE